jgi:Tfp pilus assembly protein PilX
MCVDIDCGFSATDGRSPSPGTPGEGGGEGALIERMKAEGRRMKHPASADSSFILLPSAFECRPLPADRERGQCRRRRGAAAVLAMLFLSIMTVLAVAMFSVSGVNVQTSANLSDVSRAHAAAESGLRWAVFRLSNMTRPKTTVGVITPAVANTMWTQATTGIRDRFASDLGAVRGPTNAVITVTKTSTQVSTSDVPTDGGTGPMFRIVLRQLGTVDGLDTRYLRVTSTGQYRGAVRTVSMNFQIEKRSKYAVVGRVPIQLGRNTIVEGPVAMAVAGKYPPILMLSDFMHFDSNLKTKLQNWNNFLKGSSTVSGQTVKNHIGYDNRVSVNNPTEYPLAYNAGYRDTNGDANIDEYDLFLKQYDANNDKRVSTAEFTNPSTGQLYDDNLFKGIDTINGPLFNEDKNGNGVLDTGEDANGNGAIDVDATRVGYNDGYIDNSDGYAKVRGQLSLAATATAWQADSSMSGKTINDMIQGTIVPTDPGVQPVKFGVPPSDVFDLDPANFEQCAEGFRTKAGPNGGTTKRQSGVIENADLTAADVAYSPPHVKVTAKGSTTLTVGSIIPKTQFDAANVGLPANQKATSTTAPTTQVDQFPFGATPGSHQAKYQRPVYRGISFKNVRIPKGVNALFENCTFDGVTFVDMTHDITKNGTVTYNKDDGMTWSQQMKSGQGSFSKDTVLTTTNSKGFDMGNNVRFNNCYFGGPVAGAYATAYTHFTNSWEFTGETRFDNKVDDTATIVAPQTNIEMGSFTKPTDAPSTLVGVVVAGNIDIRGTSTVDGSIIITGDGAGNTTLAYFGASDNETNPDVMPEGGFGRLNIRYNPYRALPDGINIAVDVTPIVTTYSEGL